MQPQLLREIGEALAVLVQTRRLAPLAPDGIRLHSPE